MTLYLVIPCCAAYAVGVFADYTVDSAVAEEDRLVNAFHAAAAACQISVGTLDCLDVAVAVAAAASGPIVHCLCWELRSLQA